jgi:sec-independent protein translocase protein TatB
MFNLGAGEIALILVVALLVLGPKRLPELARGIGKFMREFRRQTDEVRGVVEREFYRMDQEIQADLPAPDSILSPPPTPVQAPRPPAALGEEPKTQPGEASAASSSGKPPAEPGGS